MKTLFKVVLAIVICYAFTRPCSAATHIFYWGDNSSVKTNIPAAATNIVSITGGDDHIVALRADGSVFTWGINFDGATQQPTNLANAVAITAGSSHSLALLTDGTLIFWGDVYSSGVRTLPAVLGGEVIALAQGSSAQNILAQRADGTLVDCGNPGYGLTNVPVSATNVAGLAVGSYYAAVLRGDGKVVTWGQFFNYGSPNPPLNLSNVVAVSGGIDHALALKSNGRLVEWGNMRQTIPAAATNIVSIACGGWHSLALRADGKLFAWGDNTYGELNIPAGLSNIVGIAGTTWGSLVLTADNGPPLLGQVLLNPAPIGSNARLQVTAISTSPVSYQWYFNGVAVNGATNSTLSLTNVQFAQAGAYSVIVSNAFGAATNSNLNLAVVPLGITVQPQSQTALLAGSASFNVAAIGPGPFSYQWQFDGTNLAGATNSTLVLTNLQFSDGGPYSVGISNSLGGIVSSNAMLTVVPLLVTAVPRNQQSFPGVTVTMSISVQCDTPISYQWQFQGVLLNGATGSSLTLTSLQYNQAGPYSVTVTTPYTNTSSSLSLKIVAIAPIGGPWNGMDSVPWGLTDVVAVANGNGNTLALGSDGTVLGWGNSVGPVPNGLTNAAAVAAGTGYNLVLNADGTVVGWGALTPPPGLTNVVAIASGYLHSLALKADGTVVAWGDNTYGQTNVPAGLTNVVAIAAGHWHSLALYSNGTVTGWGAGLWNSGTDPYFGQAQWSGVSGIAGIAAGGEFTVALLADGTVTARGVYYAGQTNVPAGLSNVVAMACGDEHTLALRADGTVVAWGDNSNGEISLPAGLGNVMAVAGSDVVYGCAIVNQPPVQQAAISNPVFNANGFSFSFPSQSGRVYLIEYKNSLSDSSWTPLPLVGGTGRLVTVNDPTTTSAQRFYRIRRW